MREFLLQFVPNTQMTYGIPSDWQQFDGLSAWSKPLPFLNRHPSCHWGQHLELQYALLTDRRRWSLCWNYSSESHQEYQTRSDVRSAAPDSWAAWVSITDSFRSAHRSSTAVVCASCSRCLRKTVQPPISTVNITRRVNNNYEPKR